MNNNLIKMSEGEAHLKLKTICQETIIPLTNVASNIIFAELLMRCIANSSESMQLNLKEIIATAESEKKFKEQHKDYWNCKLHYLTQAIVLSFRAKLNAEEETTLNDLRKYRNALAHGNIVSFLMILGFSPEGRKILQHGKRNILEEKDVIEACLTPNGPVFNECSRKVNSVIEILQKIFVYVATTNH